MTRMNQQVLMSGADYFDDGYAINPYMDDAVPIDIKKAKQEHAAIASALTEAGIAITTVAPPDNCQDGVYTANWALCKDELAVMSRLPGPRKDEEPYAEKCLKSLHKKIITIPGDLRFSGQGDALPCGNDLFVGTHYRTDRAVHDFLRDTLNFNVISLQTVPKRRWHGFGPTVTNPASGWPDSFFYDIDLALAVLRAPQAGKKGLIAWCPEAFTKQSRQKLRNYDGVDKIEVQYHEAITGFACNLVSTGETVIMSANAPLLKKALEDHGLKTITPEISELAKGGGYIRCTTLTVG